jgi:hypothetical protein
MRAAPSRPWRASRRSWVRKAVQLTGVAAILGSLVIAASASSQTTVAPSCSWTSPGYLHAVLTVPVAKSSSTFPPSNGGLHCQWSLWNPHKLGSGLLDIYYFVPRLGAWPYGNLKQDDQQSSCKFSKVRGLGVMAVDELCQHKGAVHSQTLWVDAGPGASPGELNMIGISVSETPTEATGNKYHTIPQQGHRLEQILHHLLARL